MKRKRGILFCIVACMALLAACVSFPSRVRAEAPENAGDYAYWFNEKYQGYEIIKCRETALRVEIPGSINGIPVTSVADKAFMGMDIVEAVIPDSVIAIGEDAFRGCARLKNVTLPRNLKTLGREAFKNCKRLKDINLPDSLAELPNWVFEACYRLEEIEIPKNIVRIGTGAFCRSGLKRVAFSTDSELSEIGKLAFNRCFLEEIRFPDSLEKIGQDAFQYCFRLKKAVFGENSKLEVLKLGCFEKSGLTSITVPKSVKEIDTVLSPAFEKITFKGKAPKGLSKICNIVHRNAVIKTPAKYRAKYKRILKKSKYYKKTMRIK